LKTSKLILNFLIFTALVALPPVLLIVTKNDSLIIPGFWSIFVFIAAMTFGVLFFLNTIHKKNKEIYTQAFLGATTFKLLFCLVFLLVFIKKLHPEKIIFVADFMYLYFLNTGFEIYGLLSTLRDRN
jgi:peptidoglycan/LPS O-acetylase OafA/YrhL